MLDNPGYKSSPFIALIAYLVATGLTTAGVINSVDVEKAQEALIALFTGLGFVISSAIVVLGFIQKNGDLKIAKMNVNKPEAPAVMIDQAGDINVPATQ